MEARIAIDVGTATPPYEQIHTQISSLIVVGELAAGTRLPTVRSLAGDLGVAAGTVARAYKDLEAAGLVTTNRRQGTVVAAAPLPVSQPGTKGPDWAHGREGPAAWAHSRKGPAASLRAGGAAGDLRAGGAAGEVMAAVEHLMAEGTRAGLDDKTLVSLLQGRLNQRAAK
ncbi:GntR family transcriptional regulator [Arthrobacter livingstonensis]|uniref:GntR family transcriptional regulator n=1 Tax=Arthrobacter livingstonensis TaxID=670078 RepID=A0A2V5L7S1_9MICC|nr:GntR family transcriptional regulator [Arthrobacter livingstonensis]PYI67308.1 GntR family transcriptional regulator [Arthrobacter livingstonensis]